MVVPGVMGAGGEPLITARGLWPGIPVALKSGEPDICRGRSGAQEPVALC